MSGESTAQRIVPASAAILAIAQHRAAMVKQEALEEAEVIKEEARKAGYEAGLEEGKRVAHEQVARQYQDSLDMVQRQQLMQQSQLHQWFQEMEPEMHRIVLEIAATVLKRQVETDPDVIVSQVRAALDALCNAAWVRVRVNPLHLPRLTGANLESEYAVRAERLEYVGDDSITPGGCLVEAPGARIDATIESQIERVSNTITRAATP